MKTAIQRQYESLIVRLALTLYIWRAMLLITLLCVKKKKVMVDPWQILPLGCEMLVLSRVLGHNNEVGWSLPFLIT